ncbi:inositol 1,4,5-trisphosphate receptor-interacting protein-like 1 [Heliangelus exortis]|uniref:inositol 1,4,5-trisphosphate receptor-interacting protein-like 1 n=1 Tax=Heliangelus exortis TaxID=472823 RepID=UPI003A8D188D
MGTVPRDSTRGSPSTAGPGRWAMQVVIALILALLPFHRGLDKDPRADVPMQEQMWQRQEVLSQEMARLLQEIESKEEDTFLLYQWQFWWHAGASLALTAGLCWQLKKWLGDDSSREQDNSSSEEEEEEEEEENLDGAHLGVSSLAAPTPLPVQGLPATCKVVKELVGDLLGVCRVLCKRTLMPEMHPATGISGTREVWSVHENSIKYLLPVFLQPPPGHSFSLELDTTGQLPGRHNSIHVLLDCTCWRKQLLGDALCALHPNNNNLTREQGSHLLRTLCTHSCLDVEKITCWVQLLLRSAWLLLPESHHCQLMVLPSSQTCKFQLTCTSQMHICTEMVFAVQRGSSVTYLSPE